MTSGRCAYWFARSRSPSLTRLSAVSAYEGSSTARRDVYELHAGTVMRAAAMAATPTISGRGNVRRPGVDAPPAWIHGNADEGRAHDAEGPADGPGPWRGGGRGGEQEEDDLDALAEYGEEGDAGQRQHRVVPERLIDLALEVALDVA